MKYLDGDSGRAQVGIGTLVVFIAMVLVAALASGVLINTSGYLHEHAKQTGKESHARVSNRLTVVDASGEVDSARTYNVTVFDSYDEILIEGSEYSGDLYNVKNNITIENGTTVTFVGEYGAKLVVGDDVSREYTEPVHLRFEHSTGDRILVRDVTHDVVIGEAEAPVTLRSIPES
ncbi:MAG: archaellin/type IV pilin N-terminal domain-containing protein, partial [Halodesulfurarchaeum sp.]